MRLKDFVFIIYIYYFDYNMYSIKHYALGISNHFHLYLLSNIHVFQWNCVIHIMRITLQNVERDFLRGVCFQNYADIFTHKHHIATMLESLTFAQWGSTPRSKSLTTNESTGSTQGLGYFRGYIPYGISTQIAWHCDVYHHGTNCWRNKNPKGLVVSGRH